MRSSRSIIGFNEERFLGLVTMEPMSGCWLWMGHTSKGYGYFSVSQQTRLAHRCSFHYYIEPLVNGMVIDHICRTRSCVNPLHLRQVSEKTNSLENSVSFAARNASKKHCLNGHEYIDGSYKTIITGTKTRRLCIECSVARSRKWYERKKARVAEASENNFMTGDYSGYLEMNEKRD